MKPLLLRSKISKIYSLGKTIPWICERAIREYIGLKNHASLFFITPDVNWSTDWDAYYITRELRQYGLPAQVSSTPHLLSGEILHYCDLGTFAHHINQPWNRRNQIVMTIFHGNRCKRTPEFIPLIDKLLSHTYHLKTIVTSCNIMKNRLVEWGVNHDKIKCIPLGIDLDRFKPVSSDQKKKLREALDIPPDAFCIGSFQKDGVGWEDGIEPKWVKGPDVFLRVIQKLKQHNKLFILLSAPARGYVIRGLQAMEIPYRHIPLKKYWDIVGLYQALDVYLVASREEGGPKALLEALACGIPFVSTRVGMVPDVIIDNYNGLTAENEDVEGLVESILKIKENAQLTDTLIKNGLLTIKDYQWSIIAQRYYNEVYAPLLMH